MKTNLSHLPVHKQEEIISIAETLAELVNPVMIILFGSYSRGDWQEEIYVENGITHEYKSDYDILVVTEHRQELPPGMGKAIRRKVKRMEKLSTIPHIIYHDIKFLNKELEEGHYFFIDIVKEGTMLYDSGKFVLSKEKDLDPEARAKRAEIYYNGWFSSATRLFENYRFSFGKGYYNEAIFLLHQTVERFFTAILLVYNNYKPRTHDLDALNKQVCFLDLRFKTVFPKQTAEEKRLLALLVRAYIDSRYKIDYIVDPADLEILAVSVYQLKKLTEELCWEKIRSFNPGCIELIRTMTEEETKEMLKGVEEDFGTVNPDDIEII